MKIDLLGASSDALSMIFEIIKSRIDLKDAELRIIKNTDHLLDESFFKINDLQYKIFADDQVDSLAENVFLGVYKNETKKLVYDFFVKKYAFSNNQVMNLIHPQTAISSTAKLGVGVQINPMSTVAPFVEVHDFTTINRNVSLGHHSSIGSFSTINPGVNIAGHCRIHDNVTVGMGSLILEGLAIGKNSMVAAGSLVSKDIPENVLVMGAPAKIVREL